MQINGDRLKHIMDIVEERGAKVHDKDCPGHYCNCYVFALIQAGANYAEKLWYGKKPTD